MNFNLKKFISLILFSYSVSFGICIDDIQEKKFNYLEGEELLYEVSWYGINIGTIRLKTLPVQDSGIVRYKVVAYLDSYEGLPFVNLHYIAYSDMDSAFNSLGFYSLDKIGEKWYKMVYDYRLSDGRIIVKEAYLDDINSNTQEMTVRDTIRIEKLPIQDGISLVFLARNLLHKSDSLTITTISNEKLGETFFDCTRTKSKIFIRNWRKPIRVKQLKGKLRLEGIFGLREDYKGWFSDDESAIPILAEMKVIIGSVKVELKKWKRKNWNPPE